MSGRPLRVTLDTNSVSVSESLARALSGVDVAVTTVSDRETKDTSFAAHVKRLPLVAETWVMGESALDVAVLGDISAPERFEMALKLMSGGGFPKPGQLGSSLSGGHRRLLRDAQILESHARENRDILITADKKAFGRANTPLRRSLCELFETRIMTKEEFIEFMSRGGSMS